MFPASARRAQRRHLTWTKRGKGTLASALAKATGFPLSDARQLENCLKRQNAHRHFTGGLDLTGSQSRNRRTASSNPTPQLKSGPATQFFNLAVGRMSRRGVRPERSTCRSIFAWARYTPRQSAGETIQSSSVVERSAVNRLVVGSNPTSGATARPVYSQPVNPPEADRRFEFFPTDDHRGIVFVLVRLRPAQPVTENFTSGRLGISRFVCTNTMIPSTRSQRRRSASAVPGRWCIQRRSRRDQRLSLEKRRSSPAKAELG